MTTSPSSPTPEILLRDVIEADLPIFYAQQLDPDANWMAAFAAKDPADKDAFASKWSRILRDERTTVRTIVVGAQVAGSVFCWTDDELGHPEVSYWLGREHWGQGVATRALALFLEIVRERPLLGPGGQRQRRLAPCWRSAGSRTAARAGIREHTRHGGRGADPRAPG